MSSLRESPEHVSTLKLIERLHRLPTLASRNHTFDVSTPTPTGVAGYDTHGAPAPPRDGLEVISDLYDLFDFDRDHGDRRDRGDSS